MKNRNRIAVVLIVSILVILWLAEPGRTPQVQFDNSPSEPRQRHPRNEEAQKVIVMATGDTEYIKWSKRYLSHWEHAVYSISAPPDPNLLAIPNPGFGNHLKATTATALLCYIIDHYDSLPKYIAFMHPTRSSLHHGTHFNHENAVALHSINLRYLDEHGFANLRCSRYPGCDPPAVQSMRKRPKFVRESTWQGRMPQLWPLLFGNHTVYPSAKIIATPSGGEFVVARWAVLKRPKHEYEHYRQFIREVDLDDRQTTEMFEYMWHIIFGMPPVHCPDEYICACEQFSRCSDR